MSLTYDINANNTGLYYFLGKFIPGIVFLTGLMMFVPSRDPAQFLTPSVFVLMFVMSYAAGQFLHSLSVMFDDARRQSHRDSVSEMATSHAALSALFDRVYARLYAGFPAEFSTDDVYVLVRSQVELNGRGRSLIFQALHSLCRSTRTALVLLAAFVLLGRALPLSSLPYAPVVHLLTPGQVVLFALVLVLVGAVFEYGNVHFKELYADYLVADFCNVLLSQERFGSGIRLNSAAPPTEKEIDNPNESASAT